MNNVRLSHPQVDRPDPRYDGVRVGNVRVTFRGVDLTSTFKSEEIASFAEKLGESFLREQLERAV